MTKSGRDARVLDGPGNRIGPSYSEVGGDKGTELQLQRLTARYSWVAEQCTNEKVLEVACASGQGLGLIASRASHVIGADYSDESLAIAQRTYGQRIPLLRLDAHHLPIRTGSLDVVVLLETLYFLPRPDEFVKEAARVLRPGGRLLISVGNKDCWDFNPSPIYTDFFGARELSALLSRHGFEVECFGNFPFDQPSLRQRVFYPIKRAAIVLNLIPKTMKARLWLKRIAIGKLVTLPFELEPQSVPAHAPVQISADEPDEVHQVVMAIGSRK